MVRILKLLIVLALMVGLGIGWREYMRQRELTQMENRAGADFDAGNFRSAVEKYEDLLDKIGTKKSPRRKRVHHQLALCYKHLAENPRIPFHLSAEFYHKAAAYDESVLENQRLEKLLHAGNLILPGQNDN